MNDRYSDIIKAANKAYWDFQKTMNLERAVVFIPIERKKKCKKRKKSIRA
mgnify:CR=1 FL=1